MNIGITNKSKSKFLLAAYIFIVVSGSFHYHFYAIETDGANSIFSQSNSFLLSDFLDDASGTCSFEHFMQSINFEDDCYYQNGFVLPETKRCIVHEFSPITNKVSYHSSLLRAPPTV